MRRLPAEWHPQQTVLFCFPRRQGDWGGQLHAVSEAMLYAANRVQQVCPVTLIVPDAEHFARYAERFTGRVVELPANDSWVRDSGPITVLTPTPLRLDFTFNGWGGKFVADLDNALPRRLHARLPPADYARVPVVLEGGSIESDGHGTILTTSRCLLSTGRNDFATKEEVEVMLRTQLGARRVLWLDHGELIGDDTDAHIDTVARFLDPATIAYVGPPPEGDPQRADFVAMRDQLRQIATGYELLELPWTGTLRSREDERVLPASYANFLLSNGTLFLPVYDVPADQVAIQRLSGRGYTIVPIPSRPFIEQHGGLHCLTMQIPAAEA